MKAARIFRLTSLEILAEVFSSIYEFTTVFIVKVFGLYLAKETGFS